ncbi:MAG TPA: radical SAM protein [Bacteroidales bacterium]|nr:radical SAM protein [Bacteroidales bacterium]HOX74032.1 radical SAM protein [Bacteroidales bacterium]HPM88475.1 radical SAM protein [Bacteroidales bacterium]HQM67998.1 radical SAM protein [Bacteroidales bacterium]
MADGNLYSDPEQGQLSSCTICPRQCRADRYRGGKGYCRTDEGMNIASICIHRGEEPQISGPYGICNIFFSGCNLRCIYCQNHDISRPAEKYRGGIMKQNEALDAIMNILSSKVVSVGFVSPSHMVPQVKALIRGLNERGLKPVTVYNTNGYDKPEVIDGFEGLIDVYLPDYKYVTPELAAEYSDAPDYPDVALKALKRMYFQKGSTLPLDKDGRAENGMMIRHLVLPGHAEESKNVLRSIAEELSPGIHLSLMSQYHPTEQVLSHPVINRSLYREEYESVVETMINLGFRNALLQDMDSYLNYRPDFSRENPFE